MRSRWWSAGGGVGSLRQTVSAIVNVSHGHGDKLYPLHPILLGLRDFAVECNSGRRNAMASLSIMVKEIRRGISSSSLVCAPADFSNSHSSENGNNGINNGKGKEQSISFCEAKKLMRLVNVESLKMKLGTEGREAIPYSELLEACETMGVARNAEEAMAFAKVLDEAGVILLFRDKVYLHPEKVVELVRRAVPLALTADNDDPMREEFRRLQERKEQIDALAHKQVRHILWSGLGGGIILVGLFFRLTFWDFSWDIMEPIAFFTTTSGLIIGYGYFLITSRAPTYQDFMKRLFISRQRKLFKRQNFDIERFRELQRKLKTPLDASTTLRKRVGMEPDPEDVLHRD